VNSRIQLSEPSQRPPRAPSQRAKQIEDPEYTQGLFDSAIRLSRDDFINEVFAPHYEGGEHVTIVGPTGCGKTTLCFEMIDSIATPELPAIICVKKPKDKVIEEWLKLTGFKKTEVWPPITKRNWNPRNKRVAVGQKQRGWVVWPKQSLKDIEVDQEKLSKDFKKVLNDCYRHGDRIVFIDDLVGFAQEYNLSKVMTTIYMEGRAMGCGLFGAIQRPYHAPVIMYGAAKHVVLFKDPDQRSVDRFKEIGGIDPEIVEEEVFKLKAHEALYIGRNMAPDGVSPAIAIIGAD